MNFLALIISWIVYGLIIGFCGKVIHAKISSDGKEPIGYLSTFFVGVSGSFVGGTIEWLLHFGNATFTPAGFVMSVIGSVIFCSLWGYYNVRKTGM